MPRQTTEEFMDALRGVQEPLLHAVTYRFHDETSPEDVERGVDILRGLGSLPGIISWSVLPSLDQRKGRTALELGVFEHGQAVLDFRVHPIHVEATNFLQHVSDWVIVDAPLAALNPLTPAEQLAQLPR